MPADPTDTTDPAGTSGRAAMDRPDEDSFWVRTVVGWHVAWWLMMAIVAAAVTLIGLSGPRGDPPVTTWIGGLACVAGLCLGYVVLGAPAASDRGTWRTPTFLGLLVTLVATLLFLLPGMAFVLFIAFPQAWFLTDRLRDGVGWTVALAGAVTVAFAARAGFTSESLRDSGISMLVSLLFSLLLGVWISRVIDQSQERGELVAELRATRAELETSVHNRAVMAERERFAAEIHDTLAQGFSSIVVLAQSAEAALDLDPGTARERLRLIEDTSRDNLAEARSLVAAFAPAGLDGAPLTDALTRLAQRFSEESGVVVDLQVSLGDELGRDREVVLLRAAQEALTNVRRHAGARSVVLRVDDSGDAVDLVVRDDGRGLVGAGEGFGLAGMRQRVESVGGGMTLVSTAGSGTELHLRLPVTP